MPGLPARADTGPELRYEGDLPGAETVLSDEALAFVAELAEHFGPRVEALVDRRQARQHRLDRGEPLGFLPETADIRSGDWKVAPLPKDLLRRRVEITGPVSAKMVINALNSGADVFMADFEDATCPVFHNQVDGQKNLMEAVRGTLAFRDEKKKKDYTLNDERAVLMVRPRGWHLPELHVLVGGKPIPGALFDFGMYFFHNAKALLERGSGPYFYLPKLESHLEAGLWNDVFVKAQDMLGVPQGSIKATVLIETLPAVFEMDEILHELKDHMAGLNCGRWDYIFSCIKVRRADPNAVIPDRSQVGMTQPFMSAYTQLLIKTCHRRGAFAMGGMAAQIPLKDPEANDRAIAKVQADKQREADNGHDGTWVAHPGLVPVAMEIFKKKLGDKDNQLDVMREDVDVTAEQLLAVPEGTRSLEGVRTNIRVGVQYLEAWLRGNGCVPLYGLMEDAATAEISRAQLWQQIKHNVDIDGEPLTSARFKRLLDAEMVKLKDELGDAVYASGRYGDAAYLFSKMVTDSRLADFLTLPAYRQLVREGA
jgi:malate synthase